MAWSWDKFPYTNFHELNLVYILKVAKYAKKTADLMLEWKREHQKEYEELVNHVDKIQAWIDGVESGNIPQALIDGLATWIDNNLQDLISRAIKFVWFGLTTDGYFVAYIPDSWDELTFDTCMDFANEYYGHLLICYDDAKLQHAETYHRAHRSDFDLEGYWNKEELQPYGA